MLLCVHGATWSFQARHAACRCFADAHVVQWQVAQLSHKACCRSDVLDSLFGSRLLQQCCSCWIRLILEIDSSWSSAIALYNALQNIVFNALRCLTSQANQLNNLFSLHPTVVESCSHGFGTLVAVRKQGSQEDLGEACLISFPSKYCLYSCEWKGSKASKASGSWQWWNQGAEMHSKLHEKCAHSWGQRSAAVDS